MLRDPTERLQNRLQPGEVITWSGGPAPMAMVWRDVPWVLFSLAMAGGVLLVAVPQLLHAHDLAQAWSLAAHHPFTKFAGAWAVLTLLTPLWHWHRAARTLYAVTNRRALILNGRRFWEYPADSIPGVSVFRRLGGTADIVFVPPVPARSGVHLTLQRVPQPPTRGGATSGTAPDGFRAVRDAAGAESSLRRMLDARARDLAVAPSIPLAADTGASALGGTDNAFRIVTHPVLHFSIEVPPGTVTFNSAGNKPESWPWNVLDIRDRDGGPPISVRVEPAPPTEAESVLGQFAAHPDPVVDHARQARRGPVIDGVESVEVDASAGGAVRMRQLVLYQGGCRYTIIGNGSFATPAAEALFQRVASSLKFGSPALAPTAPSVAEAPAARASGPVAGLLTRPGRGGFVAALVLSLASVYLNLWPLAVIAALILWRNHYASAPTRALIVALTALPHVVVAIASHFMPPQVIEVEPATLVTSAQQWLVPYVCLGAGLFLIRIGRYVGRGKSVAVGAQTSSMLTDKRAGLVMISMAVAVAAIGLLSSANLTDDFERVEIAPNGHWHLVHTVWGTVADVAPGGVRSITSRRDVAMGGSRAANYNRWIWHVVVTLSDGRMFQVKTYNMMTPEAVASLRKRM